MEAERLKEKLGKQDFHYDMKEVFEPVTENQKQNQTMIEELSGKQIQALRYSSQNTTQAIMNMSQNQTTSIDNQTRAIQNSSDILNENLQKPIQEGLQVLDEISNRNNQLPQGLVNSTQVDS